MSNLRTWLAHVEHDLSTPLVYKTATMKDTQNQLQQQQVSVIQVTPFPSPPPTLSLSPFK